LRKNNPQFKATVKEDGNFDVFMIPAVAGEPKRLTWYLRADPVRFRTQDNRNVIFTSEREKYPTVTSIFYKVSLMADSSLPLVVASLIRMVNGQWKERV
jgi:hypothetical protein